MRCFLVMMLWFVAVTCWSQDYYRYGGNRNRMSGSRYAQYGFRPRPRRSYFQNFPSFYTIGFPPEKHSTPAPPAEPLNPILNSLSRLPQSLYNNFICNKLASRVGSPNVQPYFRRQKRAAYTQGFFGAFYNIKRIVEKAYVELKPFYSNEDIELRQKIRDAAHDVTSRNVNNLNVENVVLEFIKEKLKTDGIAGDAREIYAAIKQLGSLNADQIAASTKEAVDKSCSAITNKFYCKYISKMVQNSGCSGKYFSTEIWDKCCSSITSALTTQAPTTQSQTTQAPATQAQTSAPTTQALTTQAPTTQAPTTQAIRTCGVSTLNPAARFADVSRALNQVRIVGGVNTEKCEYPWMVRLAIGNNLCGGSIIDETHILTAGHCFSSSTTPGQVTVHVGEHDFTVRDDKDVAHQASAIAIHPQYTTLAGGAVEFDAAIVTLANPIQYNECVQPICIPEPGVGAALRSATQCTVTGWGRTVSGGQASTILKEVTIPTYSGTDCTTGVFTRTRPSTPSAQLCAGRPVIGGADSCQGDSGGPLFCPVNGRYVQYGIVSYGAGCADAGAAGIYTDVSAITSFISSVNGV